MQKNLTRSTQKFIQILYLAFISIYLCFAPSLNLLAYDGKRIIAVILVITSLFISLLNLGGIKSHPFFILSLNTKIKLISIILLMLFSNFLAVNQLIAFLEVSFCLGLFLAQSLMSLQLWSLAELAGPILLLLLAQVVVVVLFASLVIFRMMGSNYDAAVMSAGYAGLALGATPTAIANMTAVTQKFGASTRAFIVVPLVGAFFIDIANALIIQALITWVD